jgi:hypothetical protein
MGKKATSFKMTALQKQAAAKAVNWDAVKAEQATIKEEHRALSQNKQDQAKKVAEMNQQWNKLKGTKR